MTKSIDTVDRLLTRFHMATLARHIERNAAPPTIDDAPPNPRALPGDTRRLRGIPAIGYGVQGAIPGTRPDTATRPSQHA
jgi:hypothetical protein